MIQKIRNTLLILASMMLFAVPAVVPVAVSAQEIKQGLCHGAEDFTITDQPSVPCEDTEGGGFNAVLERIINIISVIIGVIAVIMIIFGGLRYITSGGDSTRVGNAKNTILYALIGLIIVALAQVIVRFVLTNTPT